MRRLCHGLRGKGWIAQQFIAQVGEWLKPTDCKSVPPSEVRRFESFPVHQIEFCGSVGLWPASRRDGGATVASGLGGIMSRLAMALIAYAVLGALAFATLSDFRIRSLTLLILGLFAFKSWMHRKEVLHPDGKSESD